MAHFAHVNNGIVDSVIVIEQETIDAKGGWECPECKMFVYAEDWVQTSYNTQNGVHKLGGAPLRKNYAGIGDHYDVTLDAFIPEKKHESWVLDEEKGQWQAPKVAPEVDLKMNTVEWSEKARDWVVTPRAEVAVIEKIL